MNHKSSIIFTFLLMFLPFLLKAQGINYDKIIPSDSAANNDIQEKLVLLAWKNNPDNAQVLDNSLASNYEYKTTTVTWLNSLVFTGNLNEYTIHGTSQLGASSIYFPRYNIGLNVPLGIYFVNHYTSRAYRKKYDVTLDQINSQKLEIRRKVLNAYQEYVLAKELLQIQTSTTDEASTQYQVMQKKFKENRGTLQAYNDAQQKFNAETITKLTYQRNYQVAKNDLERLIGMNLEEVIK